MFKRLRSQRWSLLFSLQPPGPQPSNEKHLTKPVGGFSEGLLFLLTIHPVLQSDIVVFSLEWILVVFLVVAVAAIMFKYLRK